MEAAVLAAMLWSSSLHGSPIDSLNTVRSLDCRAGAARPTFITVPALNRAAQRLSRGEGLHAALAAVDYRADETTAIHMSGIRSDHELRVDLRARFCEAIRNPKFTAAGAFRSGGEVWLVIAAPFSPPARDSKQQVAQTVLELVNVARTRPRLCGREHFAAAGPIRLSDALNRAAQGHADNMAASGELEHRGRDGSTPAQRVASAGYDRAGLVGENIAGGAQSAQEVVNGWLNSPGHCANLMNGEFVDMGIAFAVNPRAPLGIYWAQELARPILR